MADHAALPCKCHAYTVSSSDPDPCSLPTHALCPLPCPLARAVSAYSGLPCRANAIPCHAMPCRMRGRGKVGSTPGRRSGCWWQMACHAVASLVNGQTARWTGLRWSALVCAGLHLKWAKCPSLSIPRGQSGTQRLSTLSVALDVANGELISLSTNLPTYPTLPLISSSLVRHGCAGFIRPDLTRSSLYVFLAPICIQTPSVRRRSSFTIFLFAFIVASFLPARRRCKTNLIPSFHLSHQLGRPDWLAGCCCSTNSTHFSSSLTQNSQSVLPLPSLFPASIPLTQRIPPVAGRLDCPYLLSAQPLHLRRSIAPRRRCAALCAVLPGTYSPPSRKICPSIDNVQANNTPIQLRSPH